MHVNYTWETSAGAAAPGGVRTRAAPGRASTQLPASHGEGASRPPMPRTCSAAAASSYAP